MRKGVLTITNTYSRLVCNDMEVIETLAFSLRKRAWNYYNSRAYQQKKWDGFRNFFSLKTGKFLTGLLPEVKYALKHLEVDVEVIDTRKPFNWLCQSIDKHFLQNIIDNNEVSESLKDKKIILFDYQVDFVNQIIKHNRGVIQAPTSAGKTNVMISVLKLIPKNTPTLVLCNKKQLVEQNYLEIKNWGFNNVGRLYDSIHNPDIITCATYQSLHHIQKLLPYIKCLIVDEVHEMMSKETKNIYPQLTNACIRMSVSATPFKHGGKDEEHKYFVKGHFGPILKTNSVFADEKGVLQTKTLQTAGILSKSNCVFYKIKEPEIQYAIYQDAIKLGIVENLYLHNIVKRLVKKLKGRTLILVERIDHGDTLNAMIENSIWVRGEDTLKTRKEVIEKLKYSTTDVVAIATQGIFNTGINVFVNNFLNVASGKAEHVIKQRIGRGLRVANDKDILNYFDFYFENNEYLEKHSKKRFNILKKEGHNIEIKDVDF